MVTILQENAYFHYSFDCIVLSHSSCVTPTPDVVIPKGCAYLSNPTDQ